MTWVRDAFCFLLFGLGALMVYLGARLITYAMKYGRPS